MSDQDAPPVNADTEQKTPSRRGGRPEYKPTPEQRAKVRELVAAPGKPKTKTEIAAAIGVSRVTLRRYFADELGKAPDQVDGGLLDFAGERRSAPAAEIGRPEFEPNYRQREDVQLWKADGWSDDRIARRLRISRNTLLKHFAEELSDGADAVRAFALRNLRQASLKGSVPASNALLKLAGLEPPPAPLKEEPAPSVEPPAAPTEKLGKKEVALREAQHAEHGTHWAEYMSDDDLDRPN